MECNIKIENNIKESNEEIKIKEEPILFAKENIKIEIKNEDDIKEEICNFDELDYEFFEPSTSGFEKISGDSSLRQFCHNKLKSSISVEDENYITHEQIYGDVNTSNNVNNKEDPSNGIKTEVNSDCFPAQGTSLMGYYSFSKNLPSNLPAKKEICCKSLNHKNGKNKTPDPVPKNYKCELCSQSFKSKQKIKKHIYQLHIDKKSFTCTICGKSFTTKYSLSNHEILHTGKNSFICAVCNKSFVLKRYLLLHMETHSNKKPCICKICSKCFKSKDKLSYHHETYHKEEIHVCKICRKQYKHEKTLKQHILTHSNEKRFRCQICGKSFVHNCSLKLHSITHSGEEKFKCKICCKSFYPNGQLKIHLLTHLAI